MGTTAQKLQAVLNSKAAMKTAIASNFSILLGDVLSAWPNDLYKVSISGDLQEWQYYQRFGGKGNNFSIRQSSAEKMPPITTVDIDFAHTTFPYQSFFCAFCGLTSLTTIPRVIKPKARKITAQPGSFFGYAFSGCTGLTGEYTLDISEACDSDGASNIGVVQYAFQNCTGITGVNLIWPETFLATQWTNYTSATFSGCTGLRWAKIRGLANNSKYAINSAADSTFASCTNLASMEWTDIKQAYGDYNPSSISVMSDGGGWFGTSLPNLTTVSFPSMEILNIAGALGTTISLVSMFRNVASSLEHIYLPKCYYIAKGAFNGLNCTVHLSQSNRAALSQLDGYSDNFTWTIGAGSPSGNVTLVFDQ